MSFLRSNFRFVNAGHSYQVSSFGPSNNQFTTFSPSSISGLTFWLDLSDSAYVTSSANFIDGVGNKGTAGGSAFPNVVSARPAFLQNYVNNNSVASFDGTNDILTSSINVSAIFNVAAADLITTYTQCFVLKLNRITTSQFEPYGLDVVSAWGNASWGTNIGTVLAETQRIWHGFGSADAPKWVKTGAGVISSGSVISLFNTYKTGSINMYVNGIFSNSVVPGYNATSVDQTFRIGNEIFPSAGNPAKFDLCEFLLYTGSLSPTELTQIHTYLQSKWGI